MPKQHFFTASESLCQQVTDFLIQGSEAGHLSLEDTVLITPTAGAGRQIANRLKTVGFKAPKSRQPMQALLPERKDVASNVERGLAWAEAIRSAPDPIRQTLFWKKAPETLAELLKAGRNFNKLCDLLAEGALAPDRFNPPAPIQDGFEANRWKAIEALYQSYLQQLEGWHLQDPNDLRLKEIETPSRNISHLIICCIPDLSTAAEHYAKALETKGTKVELLIWNPVSCPESDFDDWGRPQQAAWKDRLIEIEDSQIHVATSAQDEARHVASIILAGPTSLVSVDPKHNSAIASELLANGHQPYRPEGEPLIHSQAAKLALEWSDFIQSKDLRRLRRLLELPAFYKILDPVNPVSQSDALSAIDHLLGKSIASTLDSAWAASPALPEDAPKREQAVRGRVRRLLGTVRSLLTLSVLELLERAFHDEDTRTQSTKRVLEICRQLSASPAVIKWSSGNAADALPQQIFAQAIRSEQVQEPAEANSIPLNGWLEAPWRAEPQLVLSGLVEGRLPQSIDGDPFLPDTVRPELGLNHNEQRLTRDAYLLHSLLATRPSEQVHLSFSKYNPEGDPNRPSRLLFRTRMKDLPERTMQLTQAKDSTEVRPTRQTNWRWQLPEPIPEVKKISPTQFEPYLDCPFRYCIEKVMRYECAPKAAHEMDAAVFGNLIHYTLEKFGIEAIREGRNMLQFDERHIHERVQQIFESEALSLFGPQPAPAVQVQLANAAIRLYAFARVQAQCFADGWLILAVERKLEAEGEDALKIGPLNLSGMIDRIEQNAETGALRIMDYKTFSSKKTPADTHLGPLSHNWLQAARVEVTVKKRASEKTWKNLQLPLYRKILEHWYPEETKDQAPETAYFILPSDPNETNIYPFEELNEGINPGAYQSALDCAEAVAEHIHAGVFWPPQPYRKSWDDPCEALFANGSSEESIHPDTIEKLKGGQS